MTSASEQLQKSTQQYPERTEACVVNRRTQVPLLCRWTASTSIRSSRDDTLSFLLNAECYFTSARMRTGAPDPPSTLAGATTTVAPYSGTAPRLATFSK